MAKLLSSDITSQFDCLQHCINKYVLYNVIIIIVFRYCSGLFDDANSILERTLSRIRLPTPNIWFCIFLRLLRFRSNLGLEKPLVSL